MISVTEARVEATKRLQNKQGVWAAELVNTAAPISVAYFRKALQPPTEKEVLADQLSAEEWARGWRRIASGANANMDGLIVDWELRSWRRIGTQEVPVRVVISSVDAVAEFVGGKPRLEWFRLRNRVLELRRNFGRNEQLSRAVRAHSRRLVNYGDAEFNTIIEVVTWLRKNSVQGLRPRQLPIHGVDSKWFGQHRSIVEDLHDAVAGRPLGIVSGDHLIRIKVLDPQLETHIGMNDFAAPLTQIRRLGWKPQIVFVFENLETVLAMPPHPDAVAIFGSGYAVDALGTVPWLEDIPILYWGDLDSHGFAVLHTLRKQHRHVISVLMDQETLLTYKDLWVPEPKPHRGTLTHLTHSEAATLKRLGEEGDVRLEQERIPWKYALAALIVAAASSRDDRI